MTDNPIDITVYMPCHNYGKYVTDAIESVLRQSVRSWELLVINDNSSDDSEQKIKPYMTDPDIRYFKTDGIGLPSVCNLALKNARGKYIIRLDADDIFEENILLVLKNYLDNHPECVMAFPDYYLMTDDGEVFSHEWREEVYKNDHALDMPANGACTLIRTDILREVGGYREDLGAQDGYDLWTKLKNNYVIKNINLPLFYYRRHNFNLTNNHSIISNARRNIKLGRIEDNTLKDKQVNLFIPCRENYDFVPNLWDSKLGDKSLLEIAIEKSLTIERADSIIVASDNEQVREVMSRYDDSRLKFFKREKCNTIRSESICGTLRQVYEFFGVDFDKSLTAFVYVQAPFVKAQTIEEAIYTLLVNQADCAVACEKVEGLFYKKSHFGLTPINPKRGINSNFDSIYHDAKIVKSFNNSNILQGNINGSKTVHFELDHNESFTIESELDLKVCSFLYASQQ